VSERIEALQRTVEQAFRCKARHVESKPVFEAMNGEVVWDGVVETFELDGHPKAKRCHAFKFVDNDPESAGRMVLELPPVDSAESAVKAVIAAQVQKNRHP